MKKTLFYFLLLSCVIFTAKSQITIDGNMTDWNNIPILSEPGIFPMAKVTNDATNLSFMVKLNGETFNPNAWNVVDMYLDADNSSTSGFKQWVYEWSGMDYLSQGTDLFKFSGTPGTSTWTWTSIGTNTRFISPDAASMEQSVTLSNLTTPALGTVFSIALPYYNSAWTTGDPTFLQANNWDFSQRKGFIVKSRTETTLATTADFTSANAYYYPFMKDDDIAQYLDFQSGAWASNNPVHWASWALNLTAPSIYDVKIVSSGTGSGKVQLTLVNTATNVVVKTFAEMWYPADATMTENSYTAIDLSDVPAGRYMLKLTNPTTWDTYLKVQKITLTNQTATSIENINFDDLADIYSDNNMLNINSKEATDVSIYSIDGRLVKNYKHTNSVTANINSGIYLISIKNEGKNLYKKVVVK